MGRFHHFLEKWAVFRQKFVTFFHDKSCRIAGLLKDRRVLKNVSQLEIQDAALPDAEKISRSPKLQILLCDVKTVVGAIQDSQALLCLLSVVSVQEKKV